MMTQDDAPETDDQKARRMVIVEALGVIIDSKRVEAVNARKASGIEEEWAEDEANYEGRDFNATGYSKGRNANDGLAEPAKKQQTRSTAFLNITAPYCDAAAASVCDMLQPTDDRNWDVRLTPLTDLQESLDDPRPVDQVVPDAVAKKTGGLRGMIGNLFGGAQQPQNVPTVGQVAKQELDRGTEALDNARKVLDDWLVEGRYHGEIRKVIESSARIGTGILKGPIPTRKKYRKARKADKAWAVEMVAEILPTSRWVNHWNFYPDSSCGDNIHNGAYVFEEDEITAWKLNDLKQVPGYIPEMIDLCIKEGPVLTAKDRKEGERTKDTAKFQIWYYHGQVSKQDMEACGCKCGDKAYYPAQVTMVNGRVIKVALSPLDSGEFPYDVMVWQSRTDHWAGIGIARQLRTCQKGAVAAVRNLMDNAGLSGGPQTIVNRSLIVPANGRWELTPRKLWWTREGVEMPDARAAFTFAVVPMIQQELLNLVQFWLKEAEDVTGMPALLQGQQGKAPDTVGGMTILNNNASVVKRRIARNFDDRITEPHIARYYEYLLLHGPENAKGDFVIDARGSSALIERDSQNQQLPQMVQMSLNPAFGIDPEKVMLEMLKGMKYDTKLFVLDDEKKQQMAQQQPPPPPQIAAAEIREKGATERKAMELQARAQEGQQDRDLEMWAKKIDAELGAAQLSAEERQALDDAKVTLAGISMKLRVQKELSPGPQVATPPTEPAGRAPAGEAFQK